jgi:cellulose synthase/poly-beta-1,6-N-acetylglucosamine synthase-like glycosyltransferase
MSNFQQNLTVIIYSHNNSLKVKELIETLHYQDYEKSKYTLNVLLDNCNDENIKLLEILGKAKLWRINTDIKPIGKFKALSWLFERILACENTNAFVFINADHKIQNDFLTKVNAALFYNPVIVGETIKKNTGFYNRIFNFKNKIKNFVFKHGRFYCDLGNVIQSDVLAISQEVLEKIKFKKSDYGFEEYEYSVKLKRKDVPVYYSSEVSVIKSGTESLRSLAIKDYQERYKSLITFKNNYYLLFKNTTLATKEMVLSLVYPSNTMFVFAVIALMIINAAFKTTYFSYTVDFNFLMWLIILKFAANINAMLVCKCDITDWQTAINLLFISAPLYVKSLMLGILKDITLKLPKIKRKNIEAVPLNFEKHLVDATITNGKQELPCTLEIIKTDEYSQAIFKFREKKLSSTKQPRINYAIEEIIQKLREHGFAIKICANCGYFYMTESTAAHSCGEKGFCLQNNFKNGSKDKEYVCAYDGCFNIIPPQARNYILQQLGLKKDKIK